tara:strand:- start:345 stop:719 length:375 start_codon:yes stop_codon:yes gene_type:complete
MSSADDDLINKLKKVFESVVPSGGKEEYPVEALPTGTYVKVHRFNQLGVITDAFYGDLDANNTKIIVYTILVLPGRKSQSLDPSLKKGRYYLTNEYEYEITGYLMLKPMDTTNLSLIIDKDPYQ